MEETSKTQQSDAAETPVEAPKVELKAKKAEPVVNTYFLPDLGVSVEASSLEEAIKLAEAKIKEGNN